MFAIWFVDAVRRAVMYVRISKAPKYGRMMCQMSQIKAGRSNRISIYLPQDL